MINRILETVKRIRNFLEENLVELKNDEDYINYFLSRDKKLREEYNKTLQKAVNCKDGNTYSIEIGNRKYGFSNDVYIPLKFK